MKAKLVILNVVAIAFAINVNAQGPEWVRDNTWYFDNFKRPVLSWELFRETFIGVAPAPSADFDQLFYDGIYKTKLASPGCCSGMCVMALMMYKNGGHLGFCSPPYVYNGTDNGPEDPNLETAIKIMHGYQINHGFLTFMLDLIAINKLQDANYAYDKVVEYLSKGDPPVLCISDSSGGIMGDTGHVILPYAVEQIGNTRKIYVYDPNRSYYEAGPEGKAYYDNRNNFVLIDKGAKKWSFRMADGKNYSGAFASGGRLVAVPLSVMGKKDRLPQSLLAEGALAINTILVYGGDVKIEQITDLSTNRRMFSVPGKKIENNESRRLKRVLPFNSFGSMVKTTEKGPIIFFLRGPDPVDIEIRACGEFKIKMLINGEIKEITGTGDGTPIHIQTSLPKKNKLPPERKIVVSEYLPGRRSVVGSYNKQ